MKSTPKTPVKVSGLTLIEVLFAILIVGLVIAMASVARRVGVDGVARLLTVAIVVYVIAIAWGRAWLRAPELTVYLTVFLMIGFLMVSLVPAWVLNSRESARREKC